MGSANFTIRKLAPSDNVKKFSSGAAEFQPLKTFLQKQALNFQESFIGNTYVCAELDEENKETGKVLAFVTLTSSEIELQDAYPLEDCPNANKYQTLPALKIARLAVDSNIRRSGLGSELVDLAFALAKYEIAPRIGCRFLIADVKSYATDFYYRNGFTFLDTKTNNEADHPAMFIDLLSID